MSCNYLKKHAVFFSKLKKKKNMLLCLSHQLNCQDQDEINTSRYITPSNFNFERGRETWDRVHNGLFLAFWYDINISTSHLCFYMQVKTHIQANSFMPRPSTIKHKPINFFMHTKLSQTCLICYWEITWKNIWLKSKYGKNILGKN